MLFVYGFMPATRDSVAGAASCESGEQVVLEAKIAAALAGLTRDQLQGVEEALTSVVSEERDDPALRGTRLERFFRAHQDRRSGQ
jgi:hypothetical protein